VSGVPIFRRKGSKVKVTRHKNLHSNLASCLYPVYTMKLARRAGLTSWLDERSSSQLIKLARQASSTICDDLWLCLVEYSACVSGFWGFRRQTSTGALRLDPAGGLASPDHLFCPPLANSWLRPCFSTPKPFDCEPDTIRNKRPVTVRDVAYLSYVLNCCPSWSLSQDDVSESPAFPPGTKPATCNRKLSDSDDTRN